MIALPFGFYFSFCWHQDFSVAKNLFWKSNIFLPISGDVNSSNVDDGMQNMNPVDPAYGLSVGGENSSTDPEEGSRDSEGEPNFDSGPPEDGLEYIRCVRYYFVSLIYLLKCFLSFNPVLPS